MIPKKHAILSPSSAHRWTRCAGAPAMEREFSDAREDTKYSLEGTAAHELGELCLQDEPRDAVAFVGRKAHNGVEFTEVMAGHVQTYVDYCRDISKKSVFAAPELYVPIDHVTGEEGAEGSLDFAALTHGGTLHIVDLKYGMTPVIPEENEQLILYALGAMRVMSELGLRVDQVFTTIFQPRIPGFDVKENTAGYTAEELLTKYAPALEDAASVAMYELQNTGAYMPNLTPGAKQCHWCKAKDTCPAREALVEELLEAKFDAVVEDPEVLAVPASARLGIKLDAVAFIEEWCKDVRKAALDARHKGIPVIGADGPYKLVKGKEGPRKWKDEEAVTVCASLAGIPKNKIFESSLISPTTAEKLFKAKKLKAAQWAALGPHIGRSPAGFSIANAKDPRPEATPEVVEFIAVDA